MSSLATHSQSSTMSIPSTKKVNFRPSSPDTGSTQVVHVPHVNGQAASTPGRLQRLATSLRPTHEQFLEIMIPSLKILSRSGESKQLATVGDCDGNCDGDCDDSFDGDCDNTIDCDCEGFSVSVSVG